MLSVFCLMDTNLTLCSFKKFLFVSRDIASVSHSVFPKGYSFFCQEGHENAQGGHRGVGVFARRNLSVRPLKKFSFADGQALAVLVEGIIIINM